VGIGYGLFETDTEGDEGPASRTAALAARELTEAEGTPYCVWPVLAIVH